MWLTIDSQVQGFTDFVVTNKTTLGLQGVYYGDQDHMPQSPVGAISNGRRRREMTGARQFTTNTEIFVFFVSEQTGMSRSEREKLINQITDSFEALLHADVTVGGNTVASFVSEVNPGTLGSTKGSSVLTGVRLTVEVLQREIFGG